MDISCRNTKQTVGNIITQSNFLTVKYVTDGWGTDANGFKLVLTAIKNISKQFSHFKSIQRIISNGIETFLSDHACKEFRCKSSEFCISADLMCDGMNDSRVARVRSRVKFNKLSLFLGINHCGDGTDEAPHSLCPSKCWTLNLCTRVHSAPFTYIISHTSFLDIESKTILGLEMTWLVLLAVSAFLMLSGCFVGIAIWLCRVRTTTSLENDNFQC